VALAESAAAAEAAAGDTSGASGVETLADELAAVARRCRESDELVDDADEVEAALAEAVGKLDVASGDVVVDDDDDPVKSPIDECALSVGHTSTTKRINGFGPAKG